MTTPFLSLPGFLGSAALLSMAGLLHAQSVGSSSDYVNALTSINSAVTGSTGNSYSLEFGSGLAVTPGTGAFINAGTGNTVSIDGNGGLLNGGNTLTPAVIFSGTVNLSNLTIQNGFGKGGDVSTNTFSRQNTASLASAMPGGGAGLGGGLFIATSSVVTLHNVSFEANSTFGGVFRPTGFTNTHGGNASFVLGLENVDSNGVPTAGSGNQIAGNITDASNFSAILPPGTSAGGQQSLSYIAGSAPRSGGFGSAPQGTTGSTYDGAGTNGYVSDDFQGSAASAGQGKMGGGNGSFFLNTAHGSQVHTSAGGGGGLVGGGGTAAYEAGLEYTARHLSGGGFGGGGGSSPRATGGGGGGFGGGGGGALFADGGGGFGGVGGSGSTHVAASSAGNGWGVNFDDYGYTGASLGGGIFVMFDADLTITGSSTFSGNTGMPYFVGIPDGGEYAEYELGGLGSDLFVMSGAKTTLAPGSGETLRFQGTIDDDSGAFGYNGTIYQGVLLGSSGGNGPGAPIKIGSSTNPGGTVIFEGRTGYAGGTEMNSGMLVVDGNTGSIMSGSDLKFTGKSEFRFDNTNSAPSTNKVQIFNKLAFDGGEGTVSNVKGNAQSGTLEFHTVTRAAGATGNFVARDGTNGMDNKILPGGAAGTRSPGLFFGGDNYAHMDSAGYVRGLDYGVDADSILSTGGTTIGETLSPSSDVKLTGAVTAQTTMVSRTLNLNTHDLTLADGQTLTLSGILQSRGSAAISGGAGITYGGAGGETDLVIRTDTAVDFLTISSSITAPNLTKSGSGVLLLSGSNHITGSTAINDGVLVAANNTAFGTGSVAVQAGAVLMVGSEVTLGNLIQLEGGVFLKETAAGEGFELKTSSRFEDGRNTTAEILDGTAGSATSLENNFSESSAALNDTFRLSDVYSLHGTGTDVFVLQLSAIGVDGDSLLGWLDSHGMWVNAVLGNTGTSNSAFINGAYDGNPVLGHYGVDTAGGSVWAVLNHNSDFAVITVPEPGSSVLIGIVLGALALRPRGNRPDAPAALQSR